MRTFLKLCSSSCRLLYAKTVPFHFIPLVRRNLHIRKELHTFSPILYNQSENKPLDSVTYEKIAEETLESLSDHIEELLERPSAPNDTDVSLSSGVLTVKLGFHGTYVINKQTPNKQIWLSSPLSGPKRYDFDNGVWRYKHDNGILHTLLATEFSQILKEEVNFLSCEFSQKLS